MILHGIRNTIDCKRETKWNIKKEGDDGAPGGYGTVYILFLCGKRDRRILQGKEKMTFSDFDRLNYIADFLGLKLYGLEIWNKYAGQFREQFQQLQRLYDETSSVVSYDPSETDEDQQEQWVKDFCRQVPDRKSRKQLEEIVKQLYMERGWEGI